MAVLIGHASIDERNKAKGGLAGDQTGKEVCTRNWSDKDWDGILRPKTSAIADNSARICEVICANENVGYDQNQRNSLWNAWVKSKKISPIEKVECDCSTLQTYCAILGGANIPYGTNGPTTATMVSVFVNSGAYEWLTDKKYTETDEYLRRGDILVRESNPKINKSGHTAMVLSNGSRAYEGVKNGSITLATPTLKMSGTKNKTEIKKLQKSLNTLFSSGLVEDGIFGKKTKDAVINSQTILKNAGLYTSTIDGVYGPNTANALKAYAKNKGYTVK